MRYNIVVFGVKDTTQEIVCHILQSGQHVDLIITIDEGVTKRNDISGFSSMDAFAKRENIALYKAKDYALKDADTEAFFSQNEFGVGISMGWQRLIPVRILSRFFHGVFGFHGSCAYLPFGRGRSPMNWSLIRGDTRFILNLFKYDEKADSPNVFRNVMFEITPFDTIRTLQYKNILCAKKLVLELLEACKKGTVEISANSKDMDSWYEKRTPNDGIINFGMRTREIYNLVRAVTRPFAGAFAYCRGHRITIWEAVPFDQMMDFSGFAPGQIVDIFDNHLVVRTLDGSLLVKDYVCECELRAFDFLTTNKEEYYEEEKRGELQ